MHHLKFYLRWGKNFSNSKTEMAFERFLWPVSNRFLPRPRKIGVGVGRNFSVLGEIVDKELRLSFLNFQSRKWSKKGQNHDLEVAGSNLGNLSCLINIGLRALYFKSEITRGFQHVHAHHFNGNWRMMKLPKECSSDTRKKKKRSFIRIRTCDLALHIFLVLAMLLAYYSRAFPAPLSSCCTVGYSSA